MVTDTHRQNDYRNPLVHAPRVNDSDSEGEDSSSTSIPINGEAMMLDKCLTWYECQSDAIPTSVMLLKRIKDLAAKQQI